MTRRGVADVVADAVVVGAGASGLACARLLAARGIAVVVLEARDRVGGRLCTLATSNGEAIELGAQVIHGRTASTWSVVEEARLRTEPMTGAEAVSFVIAGRAYPSTELPSRGIAPPWLVEAALVEDAADTSVFERLRSLRLSGATRALAVQWLTQVWGADAATLTVEAIADVRRAWDSGDGEWRVVDGFAQIATFLGDNLDVRLGDPVRRISWSPRHVEAITDRLTVNARAVVVTVPPPVVAHQIGFEPRLPGDKQLAAERLRLGGAVVVVHRLRHLAPSPAWALVLDGCGGFWRARAGSPFLVACVKGPRAGYAAGSMAEGGLADRVAAALFPAADPGPAEVVQVVDWGADPYVCGGFTYPSAGVLLASQAWAAPVDATLFFAGEASCGARHLATVQGALESGSRAADEVSAALSST